MKSKLVFLLIIILGGTTLNSCKKDVLETSEVQTGNYHSLQDFYDQHAAIEQVSFINPDDSVIIAGENGTLIGVHANSLVDDSGVPPSGLVQVTLREVLDIKTMVLSHTPTASNGAILQTGGTFYLNFAVGNTSYGPDTLIGGAIPAFSPIPGMKICYGQPDPEFGINWTEDSNSVVIDTLGAYVFSFGSLGEGWINIGRVYSGGTPTDVTITPAVDAERNEIVDLAIYLLFPSLNSAVNVSNTAGPQTVTAYDVPIGMQAVAAALGVGRITNKAYFGKISVTIAAPQSISFNVVQMTDQEIFDSLTDL